MKNRDSYEFLDKKERRNIIRETNRIAFPLIASSVTNILMGIMDQAFIGHISIEVYAGVGLVYSCLNSLIGVLGVFSVVFNICGSELKGQDSEKQIGEEFTVFFTICAIIGILLFVMLNIFCGPILHIGFGLEEETLKEATAYLRIFSISIPLNLLIFLYSGVFKIYKKTNHIFVTTLLINILGVLLDYIFIYGKLGMPKLGAKGAALGSVLSLFAYFVIYWWIARKYIRFQFNVPQLLQKMKAKIILSIPFIAQEFFEDILFVVGVNMIVARMGTIELSVYNLILQMIAILQMPMFGYAAATISLVGEEEGRKNRKKIKMIKKIVTMLAFSWFIIMYAVLVKYNYNVITFITDEIDVLPLAQYCIPVALMGQVFNYGINIEKAALQCMGEEKYTLYVTFIINMIVLFICGTVHKLYLLYIILGIGYGGVYVMLRYRSSQKLNVARESKKE